MNPTSLILPKISKLKENILSFLSLNSNPFFSLSILVLLFFVSYKIVKIKKTEVPAINRTEVFRKLLPTPAPYPVSTNTANFPEVTANSIKIIDFNSFVTLYERNSHQRVPPASTTKIMTALVALEQYQLDNILTAGDIKVEGNTLKISPGEKLTVENLLYGLLVGSGNDAALVLAENFPGKTEGFVWAMNQKAKELKMNDTNFVNPIGLDQDDHYSSAADMASLTMIALRNPIFAKIVSTPEFTITDSSGTINHFFKNTNELVGKIQEVKGVKTGKTDNAGECLITLVDKEGKKVVIAMLGSKDRFNETQKLIDWVYLNFDWQVTLLPNYR